jgi:hypothetical protein
MAKNIWTFISYLFHPVLMPALGIFIVMWNVQNLYIPLNTAVEPWIFVLALVFICTCILPLIISFILLKMERISSISHPSENDRRIMLGFTALCFIFIYYSFHNLLGSCYSLMIFIIGINISILVTLVISLFTSVSFHSVGVGGVLGTVIGVMQYTHMHLFPWLIGAFALVILTGLSRYKLKAHGAFEIYVGLIAGIAVQASVFFLATTGLNFLS